MVTNVDITVYHHHKSGREESWQRIHVRGVNWYGKQAVSVGESGLDTADAYTVRVPVSSLPEKWNIQNGDIVVKGLQTLSPTGSTEITRKFTDCFVVTAVLDNRRGSPFVQHIRIEGK